MNRPCSRVNNLEQPDFYNPTYPQLSGHDQFNSTFDGPSVGVFGIHEGHHSPASLYNLTVCMLNPGLLLARLYRE